MGCYCYREKVPSLAQDHSSIVPRRTASPEPDEFPEQRTAQRRWQTSSDRSQQQSPLELSHTDTQQTLVLRSFRFLAHGLDSLFLLDQGFLRAQHRITRKGCRVYACAPHTVKANREMRDNLKRLRTVDHPHVLKVLDLLRDDESYYAVFEAAEGSAEDWRKDAAQLHGVGEKLAAVFMRQLFAALLSCSKKDVNVRTVTFGNIFFRSPPSQDALWIKLLVPLQEDSDTPFTAPEAKKNQFFGRANVLYSCGMILSTLLIGETVVERSQLKQSLERWEGLSSEARSLTSALLMRNYKARPSLQQCLQDPWITASVFPRTLTPALRTAMHSLQTISPLTPLRRLLHLLLLNLIVADQAVKQMEEAFRDLDSDLSGEVSAEELKVLLFRMFPESQAAAASSALQEALSEQQTVSYTDFLLLTNRQLLLAKQNVPILFELLDTKKTGRVTTANLHELFAYEPKHIHTAMHWRELITELNGSMQDFVLLPDFRQYLLA